MPIGLRPISIKGQWGQPRPLHKYLSRHWRADLQDFEYEYPEKQGMPGGGASDSGDEEGARRHVAGKELQWRREQDMAQDVDAQADAAPAASREREGKGDRKKAFLEGFEEGYELGHEVGEKEGAE